MHRGDIQHLLYPVHMAGEAGHDDPLGGLADHRVQHRADVTLRRDETGHLGVGGVDQEQVHSLVAQPGKPGEIGQPPVQFDQDRVSLQHHLEQLRREADTLRQERDVAEVAKTREGLAQLATRMRERAEAEGEKLVRTLIGD